MVRSVGNCQTCWNDPRWISSNLSETRTICSLLNRSWCVLNRFIPRSRSRTISERRLVRGVDDDLRLRMHRIERKICWILCIVLYSSRKWTTFPRNHRSQLNSSFEKWQRSVVNHLTLRPNSDFTVLDPWMPILRNFLYQVSRTFDLKRAFNNQMTKLLTLLINIHGSRTIKSLLERNQETFLLFFKRTICDLWFPWKSLTFVMRTRREKKKKEKMWNSSVTAADKLFFPTLYTETRGDGVLACAEVAVITRRGEYVWSPRA